MGSFTDTIAAIATAPGEGAISVVRVSGPASLAIADRVFVGRGAPPSTRAAGTFVHGRITSDGGIADEVILLIYRAPHSYCREDAVEVQGHGGHMAARRILRAILDAGARLAEPGEFSKRAFLSGRIDLVQAEAVADLIRARSDRAAAAAMEQLDGALSRDFNACYDAILAVAGEIEATLDFPEDEIPGAIMDGVGVRLHDAERMLRRLLDTWDEGHMLREGVRIVIAGRPNVGKSTLLNALLGMEKAIVTHIPGTTRDIIEDNLVINGYPVILCDTAGLRATDCEIEAEGIRRARKAVLHADIVLYVLDGSRGVDGDDLREMGLVPKPRTIVVVNKADLGIRVDLDSFRTDWSVCSVCATSREGIDQLRSEIAEKLEKRSPSHPGAVISERHRRLLIATLKDVTEAKMIFSERPAGPTLSASKLRSALDALGEVTGRVYQDELLDSIFSRFCIGK